MRQSAIIEVWTSLLLDFDPSGKGPGPRPRLIDARIFACRCSYSERTSVFPNFDSFESIDASSSFSHFSIRLTCVVSEDAVTSQANPIPKPHAVIMATASTPKIITLEEGWDEEIKKKVSRNA